MVELELDLKKSLHENASIYYELSKKTRKKIDGARMALEQSKEQLKLAETAEKPRVLEIKRKRQWFEKYHWLRTRNGFLAIAGRDVKSNEDLVKKQMKKEDLFFHADVKGAAVTILIDGQKAKEEDREDAARLAAVFSKAWNAGVGAIDVYSANPDQVKISAKAGEFLAKGSFVVEGKREWYKKTPLKIKTLLINNVPTLSTVEGIEIKPGRIQKSDLAKKLKSKLGGSLDDWMQVLPQGGELT